MPRITQIAIAGLAAVLLVSGLAVEKTSLGLRQRPASRWVQRRGFRWRLL